MTDEDVPPPPLDDVEVVERLQQVFEAGGRPDEINARDVWARLGWTDVAAGRETLRRMAERGNLYWMNGNTPVIRAAARGHLPSVRWLVQEAQANLSETNSSGLTALLQAVVNDHLPVVQWLIREGGVDPGQRSGRRGLNDTALLRAAANGHRHIMDWLLTPEGGASLDEVNSENSNALSLAAYNGHEEIVRWLVLDHHLDVHHKSALDATPLLLAAVAGNVGVVKFLVQEGGADVDDETTEGSTALMMAAEEDHTDMARWLVEHAGATVTPALLDYIDRESPLYTFFKEVVERPPPK